MSPTPTPTPVPPPPGGERVLTVMAIAVGLILFVTLYAPRFTARPIESAKQPYRIDLNAASRDELLQVPGIGPSRADAILAKRAERGSFRDVGDVATVKGIGTKTLDGIRSYVITDQGSNSPPVPAPSNSKFKPGDPPIDVNHCSESDLTRLPAIGATMAGRIAAARPFASIEDLRRVRGIGAKTLEGLRPFLKVGPP
jgi:competence protein ComEA